MAYKADLKTTFEPTRVIQPIYTGGSVALSRDGKILATCLGEEALLTDLETGAHLGRIEGDGESITALTLTPDASFLVVCSRSLSLRIFALSESDDKVEAKLLRTLKPHTTPVVTLSIDPTGSLLATGGADGVIKVWDIRGGYPTHTFHGHSGIVSALTFFQVNPSTEQPKTKSKKRKSLSQDEENDTATAGYRLASGGEDGKVKIWDLHKRKPAATLDAHVSVVRSLDHCSKRSILLSGSRDRTAIVWDAKTWQQLSTVPVLEAIEKATFVCDGGFFLTGGETARLRVWDVSTGQEATPEQASGTELESIVDIVYHEDLPFVLAVRADQTLLLHSLEQLANTKPSKSLEISPLPVLRRISGTHDEVIDLAYIGLQRQHLALATNLEELRIVSLETTPSDDSTSATPYFGADVALLKGHEDIIITIATDWSGHWLATGAKDNTAKLWRLDPENNDFSCYSTFTGHAESIGAVSLPNALPVTGSKEFQRPLDHPPKFLITGSQDKTVKRWNIISQPGKASRAVYTKKAHDKDINAIATSFSGNATLFATASQDRTAKIWDAETGESIGVLRGHKRGVWSVAFAPTDMPGLTQSEGGAASSSKGMVLTGSGDKTVRIWSLADYSCLRTFEGHANSVLKIVWLSPPADKTRGIQVASAAGDGLVKIWDAQSGECAATLDNHIDRVWALAVKPSVPTSRTAQQADEIDEDPSSSPQSPQIELVSGSADSTLTFWTDTTASTAQTATHRATQRVEQDQELQNYMRASNYRDAIVLALQLNHPKRLLEMFGAVVNGTPDGGSCTGRKEVDDVITSLSDGQLWALVRRVREWNVNGRTSGVAQRVLYAILRLVPKERLLRLRRRKKKERSSTQQQQQAGDVGLVDAMADLSTMMTTTTTGKAGETESMKEVLDGLKAYTERHYQRLEKSAEERFVLLWALQQMDGVGGDAVTVSNGHAMDVEMGGH